MSGDPDLYLQALSLQVSPDDAPTVARQGLRLQGEQHLAQELVLPLPVHVVYTVNLSTLWVTLLLGT